MLNSLAISFEHVSLQVPDGLPTAADNTPLDFTTPFDVIVFIILPIVIVILYFYWRRMRNRDRK